MHPLKILFLFPTAYFGRHTGFRGITILEGKKIEICSASPRKIHRDGEYGGTAKRVTLMKSETETLLSYCHNKKHHQILEFPVISDGVSVCYILIMCLICN